MTAIILLLIAVVCIGFGVAYFSKTFSRRTPERVPGTGEEVKNGTPVTLDRNPEMPKMPGATS